MLYVIVSNEEPVLAEERAGAGRINVQSHIEDGTSGGVEVRVIGELYVLETGTLGEGLGGS